MAATREQAAVVKAGLKVLALLAVVPVLLAVGCIVAELAIFNSAHDQLEQLEGGGR